MYASTLTALALLVAAPGATDSPKKEATIVGEWLREAVVGGGKEGPKGDMLFAKGADGKMTIKQAKRVKAESAGSKIDTTKTPHQIDIIPEAGKTDTIAGIFNLEGDALTICFTPGGERPTEFKSPEGTRTLLMTLKRV